MIFNSAATDLQLIKKLNEWFSIPSFQDDFDEFCWREETCLLTNGEIADTISKRLAEERLKFRPFIPDFSPDAIMLSSPSFIQMKMNEGFKLKNNSTARWLYKIYQSLEKNIVRVVPSLVKEGCPTVVGYIEIEVNGFKYVIFEDTITETHCTIETHDGQEILTKLDIVRETISYLSQCKLK